ncbi:MAG: metallophosphoesterase family protein [Chloroflexota bacterium]
MTRLALLSDIHGNLPALEVVIADMAQFAPDHVVVAGDNVNLGPFSAEVLHLIHERRWTHIRGNNEYYIINAYPPRKPETWAHFTMLEFLHDQLTDWHHYIAGMPDDLLLCYPDAPDVHLCHAIPDDCWTGIYSKKHMSDEQVTGYLAGARAKTIFCGHTHLPLDRRVGDFHIINPGSVGQPLMGEPVISYMIVDGNSDGWQVTHHRQLPMETDRLFPKWESQNFVGRCGVTARIVMEEFKQTRLMLHTFNVWMADQHPDEIATHAHGDAFLAMTPAERAPYVHPCYRLDN